MRGNTAENRHQPDPRPATEARSTGRVLGVEPTGEEKHQSGQAELHTRPHRRSRNSSWQKRDEEAVRDHKNTVREEQGPLKSSERQERQEHHK